MDLAELIAANMRGRTYEQIAADCGGEPSRQRLWQILQRKDKEFPIIEARTQESVTITCDTCVTRGTGEAALMRRIAANHDAGHVVTEKAGYDQSVLVSDKTWAKRHGLSI